VIVSPQLSGWYWLPSDLVATNALMVDYEPSDVDWMCSSATLVGHLTVLYEKLRSRRQCCDIGPLSTQNVTGAHCSSPCTP
jgi:hypothetical protein